MRNHRRITRAVAAAALLAAVAAPVYAQVRFEATDVSGMRWLKGNTHAHTVLTDGDSPPGVVAAWYKTHGYDWLVITDHDVLTAPATLATLMDSTFLLIPGEEVTGRFEGKPVHVNAIDIDNVVAVQTGPSVVATLQANIDAIRAAGGVPQVNHPNFGWAFGADELEQVKGVRLMEIASGHPLVNMEGGGGAPGIEAIWDRLLTAGHRIYGMGVDDSHHWLQEFAPHRANPGRAWVVVRARSLDAGEIAANLDRGLFYASTGVRLDDVTVKPDRIEIRMASRTNFRYTTRFIGDGGRVLLETGDNPAIYTLRDEVTYVRAKVVDSNGAAAWVQPVFVAGRQAPDR
jgi:hypothetical protein